MSLSVDGVWAAGVWATTAWADGVWREGAAPAVAESPSGGWAFYAHYEREREHRRKKRREHEEREEESERISDATTREIAQLLRQQEAQDERRAELDRLATLVEKHAGRAAQDAYGERVAVAMARAHAQGNVSALLALEREIERAKEDEDWLLLAFMTLEAED